jgi:hypothetical protein
MTFCLDLSEPDWEVELTVRSIRPCPPSLRFGIFTRNLPYTTVTTLSDTQKSKTISVGKKSKGDW